MRLENAAGGVDAPVFARGGLSSGWSAVLGGFFGLCFGPSVLLLLMYGVFAPALRHSFGWGVGAVSLGATIVSLSMVALSPVQGWLVDRFGVRLVVLVSLPLFGTALSAMAGLGSDIRVFYFACALLTVISIGVWPLAYLTLFSTWFDRRLGLALGVGQIGAGLGGAVIPVVLAIIFSHFGWRGGYVALGLTQIFLLWPIAFWAIRQNRLNPSTISPAATAAQGLSFSELSKTRAFYLLLAAFVALGAFSSGVIIHLVSLVGERGFSARAATGSQSVLLGSAMVARLAFGWALDRVRLTILTPCVLVAAALACAACSTALPLPEIYGCAVVIGVAFGAEFDVLGYAIRRYFGLHAYGAAYGAIFAGFQVGSAMGAGAIGYLREYTGSYSAGLLALAALCVLASVLIAGLGRYRFGAATGSAAPAEPILV